MRGRIKYHGTCLTLVSSQFDCNYAPADAALFFCRKGSNAVSNACRCLGKEFRSHLQGLAPTSTAAVRKFMEVHELQARYGDLERRKFLLEQETERLQSQVGRIKEIVASVKCTSEEGSSPAEQAFLVDAFDSHTTKSCLLLASDGVPSAPLFKENAGITDVDKRLNKCVTAIGSNNEVTAPVVEQSPMGRTPLGLAQLVVQSTGHGSVAGDTSTNLKFRRERVRQQHFLSRFSSA
jgi:hypothetical protein